MSLIPGIQANLGGVKTDLTNVYEYSTATLLESRSGTTGLRTWLASFPLAQYLIQNPGALLLVNHSKSLTQEKPSPLRFCRV